MKNRSNYKGTKSSYQQSAPFQTPTETLYQHDGTEDFETGETENINRSGVLFNVSELPAVNTALELRFSLPTEIGSETGATLLRRGHIVRTILPPTSDQLDLMAVGFSDCQLRFSGDETPEDC